MRKALVALLPLLVIPSTVHAAAFSCTASVSSLSVTTDGLVQVIFRPDSQSSAVSYNYCYIGASTPISGSGGNPIAPDTCKSYYGLFLTAFSTDAKVRLFFQQHGSTSDCSTLPPGHTTPVPFPYAAFVER